MERAAPERSIRASLGLLALLGLGVVATSVLMPKTPEARALTAHGSLFLVYLVAGAVTFRHLLSPGGWRAGIPLAAALAAAGVGRGVMFVQALAGPGRPFQGGTGVLDLAFLLIGVLVVLPFVRELRDHFAEEDRSEVGADVALIAAAGGGILYLLIRPGATEGMSSWTLLSSVVFALVIVTPVAAWGALALWVPSPMHLGVFAAVGVTAGAAIPFAFEWVRGSFKPGEPATFLPFGLAALAFAAMGTIERRLTASGPPVVRTRWGRPILTAVSVAAACASLAVAFSMQSPRRADAVEGSVLLAVLAMGIVVRILINQLRATRSQEETRQALVAKEGALGEAASALERVQEAHRTLASSEERLRLLFDAAVDGIVELDRRGVIRRANEAFCSMIDLRSDQVVGRAWTDLASSVEGADPSFGALPLTGETTLGRDGHGLHLEARASELPGPDGGRLLLIRDVTSAKVADQTIRQLFKFLQDRDDDRTRLLRRTNAAIEQERNRIARDLHDGPVQGVSAASLSLEAVLLMLKGGSVEQGIDVLTKVRSELAEETDNLRRLMADLRPPVLEERGLVPALRDVLERFGRDTGIRTGFRSRSLVEVPADLETLAYRIVQEALSNSGKHSRARSLEVSVEAVAGQLRIEIADDGDGFEASRVRDFLRMGRVGLASMRERTELANGTFMVRSSPGSGTTVVATLPLDLAPAPSEAALA
ncbi:MAG: PAS domain S-box protein [Actinobacteria bacterium]|nr:PAS domain S-box protein [Actinomycetota bacterium]